MKKIHYLFLTASALSVMFGVASCGSEPSSPQADYDFTVELKSKRSEVYLNRYVEKGEKDQIVVHESNKAQETYYYTYKVPTKSHQDYISVDSSGFITPLKLTDSTVESVKVRVEARLNPSDEYPILARQVNFRVTNRSEPANAGANYSSDKEEKNVILGKLESFAMNNFLTGITLFENGGWVRYADRVTLGSDNYIAGYGFGLLSEGSLTGNLPGITDSWPTYLRTATSSETYSINAWNAEGSQISDLNGYITSSFWSTKIDESGNKYTWYPCLAADEVVRYDLENGGTSIVPNNRPVPVGDDGKLITKDTKNDKGLYRRWRVYVKTDEIKYRTMANNGYDMRTLQLEDYVFPFKLLLTQACGTFRGAELASDTSYGIKGGYSYFRNTKDSKDYTKFDELFNEATGYEKVGEDVIRNGGDLGISTGLSDSLGNGEYIEFELINPIDDFTAMYTLSSNLYSPLPESFMVNLPGTTNGWVTAAKLYGEYAAKPDGEDDTSWFRRNMLCVGPFYLERWDTTSQVIFKQNTDWFEHKDPVHPRYHIPGVHISIESKAQKDPDHVWNLFNKGKLDSAGIPKSYLEGHSIPESNKKDRQTRGDSTFKLNVNSCDQHMSDKLFGPEGKIEKHDPARTVKPWMSNNNFLRGLFWSIKRKDFAAARGVNPSYEYFADAYLTDIYNESYDPDVDPIEDKYKSVAYNTTDAHKGALTDFLGFDPTDPTHKDTDEAKYGYSNGMAVSKFKTAVAELLENGGIPYLGTKESPYIITIDIWWMYQSDIEEYGKDIKNYFEEAFNDNEVANSQVKLVVNNEHVTDWQDVYKKHLMTGEFDLGFGAISGNTLNPLNFLEVLRSDNSSGFTLNWGTDTSEVSETYPIIYDGQLWSYDALWAAGDHGVIAEKGAEVKPVKSGYMKAPKSLDGGTLVGGDLSAGGILQIDFEFVDIDSGVDFDITKVQIYLPGTDNLVITVDDAELKINRDGSGKVTSLEVTISEETGEDINKRLFDANELQDEYDRETDPEKKADILKPFKMTKYNLYWSVEVYFDLKITGAMPVENVYYVAASESDVERSFARLK